MFAAHERLAGGDPNIRSGLSGASQSIVTIFMWAVLAGTVGSDTEHTVQPGPTAGRHNGYDQPSIVISLIGAAWTLVTYFVVPLIVIERRSLGDAFKTSLSMLRRTWGEQIVANFGLGIAAFLAFLVAAGITALLFFVLSPLGGFGAFIAIVIGVVLIAGVALVFATLDGIYKAALYNYAVDGVVPSLFPDDAIRGAFRPEQR